MSRSIAARAPARRLGSGPPTPARGGGQRFGRRTSRGPACALRGDARPLATCTTYTRDRRLREAPSNRLCYARPVPRPRTRLVLSAVALSVVASTACRKSTNVPADAAPPPALEAALRPESERAKDELWKRALEGDPMDLARLSDREGAVGLLEALEEGGPIGKTALAALPYADDAEIAYQRLGEIVRQLEPSAAGPIVETIGDIAERARRQVEPLDRDGMKYAADGVLELAKNAKAPVAVRATAVTALRLLAERGAVNATQIPTDLDAK